MAHSAMMLLALAAWEGHPCEAAQRRTMRELAAGIVRQQRPDGSLAIRFEPGGPGRRSDKSSGWQLYGGEAAYAVAAAYGRLRDSHLLRAAAAALRAFQAKYRPVAAQGRRPVSLTAWLQTQSGGQWSYVAFCSCPEQALTCRCSPSLGRGAPLSV